MIPFASRMIGGASGPTGYTDWRLFITNNHGSATFVSIQELKFYDSGGSEIVATGGTPLKSTETAGNEATKAFDNTSTDWSTSSGSVANQYIGYSYPSPKNVAKVGIKVTAGTVDRTPKDCLLQYYDGATWQTLETFTLRWPVLSVERVFPEAALASGYHRAWRIWMTDNNGGTSFVGFSDAELRATSGGADQTAVLLSNAGSASGRIIGSSIANAGNEGYKAFDDVTTNAFAASGTTNQWVGFVFPTPVTVLQAMINSGTGLSAARTVKNGKIEWSDDDGGSWTTAGTFSKTGWAANEQLLVTVTP